MEGGLPQALSSVLTSLGRTRRLSPKLDRRLLCSGEKSTECIAPAAALIGWGRLVSGCHQYIVLGTDTAELLYFFARTAYRVTLEAGLPVPWGPSPLEYLYTWDPALAALVLATHGLAFPWGWKGLQLGLLGWYSGQKIQSYLFGMSCSGGRNGVWLVNSRLGVEGARYHFCETV